MRLIINEEIAGLIARFGEPLRQSHVIEVSHKTYDAWMRKIHTGPTACRGEVIMAIVRPNGHVLLHTKNFYPPGVYRVLSGRVLWHEGVEQALRNEVKEETSLDVRVERFLGLIEYEFRCKSNALRFVSYVFHLREVGGNLCCRDDHEGITDFREVTLEDLSDVAQQLEHLAEPWHDWGLFRSIAHQFVCDALTASQPARPSQDTH